MDYFKVFDSGHLYGMGKLISVAGAYEKMGSYFLEIYVFSAFSKNHFKGKTIEYSFDASDMIESDMEMYSINVMNEILSEQFKETQDKDLIDQFPKAVELNQSILGSLKAQNLHIDKLEGISKNSGCKSLREYLSSILSLPAIIIRDYKPN